jgi:uncharacterized protein YifE (UPF0438 family)
MSEMPPLSDDENALLDRYLGFYESLASGRRRPSTPAQQHFVDVLMGLAKAESPHENAYLKHRAEVLQSEKVGAQSAICHREWDSYDFDKCK